MVSTTCWLPPSTSKITRWVFLFQTLVFQLVFFVGPHRPQEMPLQLCHEVRESVYQPFIDIQVDSKQVMKGIPAGVFLSKAHGPKGMCAQQQLWFSAQKPRISPPDPGLKTSDETIDDEAGSVLRSPIPVRALQIEIESNGRCVSVEANISWYVRVSRFTYILPRKGNMLKCFV